MKKVALFFTALAVLSCAPKDPVRDAIEQAIISDLAAPKTYKFVSYELARELSPAEEATRVGLYMVKYESVQRLDGEPIADYIARGDAALATYNEKVAAVKELAETMPEKVVARIYKFVYRADIPNVGRDFPVEVFALIDAAGSCLGIGNTMKDALSIPHTSVPEFQPYTK